MSAAEAVGIFAIIGLAALVTGLTSFGFALLAVPPLAAVVGPKEAVVVSLALGCITTAGNVVHLRGHVERPIAVRLIAGALAGLPFGLAILVAVDEDVLRLAISAAVLVSVAALVRGVHVRGPGRALDLGAGFLSGVLNTSVGTNGPPLVLALRARRIGPTPFRATLATVFVVSNVVGLLLVVAAGRFTAEVVRTTLVALPALGMGWWLGLRLSMHVRPERFRTLVLGLLIVGALVAAASVLVR